MYPQMNTNIDYGKLTDMTNMSNVTSMTDDNKRLCKDLCKVGICISCFCSLYLILFLGVINSELGNMNMTYF